MPNSGRVAGIVGMVLVLAVAVFGSASGRDETPSSVIGHGHITMGGFAAPAGDYVIGGTVGQATQPVLHSDSSFLFSAGFWYPTGSGILSDVPGPSAFLDALYGNFPNPFNPSTTVKYSLATSSEVDIDIFDLRGRLVKTLHEGRKTPGLHFAVWDGRDERNQSVGSGIYLLRIRAGGFQDVAKATLIK